MSFENWTIEELFARCTDYDDGSLSMDKEEFAALRRMLQGKAEPVTTAYKLPPHVYRELVNSLRDTAVKYQGCQQLREQISETLSAVITHTPHCGNSPVIPGGWVACSERMPEDAQWCAVSTEYGYYVQCWSHGQGWLGDDISIPNCDVTHWMPLPAAPQQENE